MSFLGVPYCKIVLFSKSLDVSFIESNVLDIHQKHLSKIRYGFSYTIEVQRNNRLMLDLLVIRKRHA